MTDHERPADETGTDDTERNVWDHEMPSMFVRGDLPTDWSHDRGTGEPAPAALTEPGGEVAPPGMGRRGWFVVSSALLMFAIAGGLLLTHARDSGTADEQVTMPALVDLDLDTAIGLLEARGLVLGELRFEADHDEAPGTVVAHDPSLGDALAPGTAVDLTVVAERGDDGEPASAPSGTATPTPTSQPRAEPSAQPAIAGPDPDTTPTSTPTPTDEEVLGTATTPTPSETPTPVLTATPTPPPTAQATPTPRPTATPTPRPTVRPTATPTPRPSATPRPTSTPTPSTPTPRPTATPTPIPVVAPSASFSAPGTLRVGESGAFTNTTTGTAPITYRWDWGNGNSTTSVSPPYAWPSPGTYTVTLTATNAAGTDSSSRTVNVLPALPFARIEGTSTLTVGEQFFWPVTHNASAVSGTWSSNCGVNNPSWQPGNGWGGSYGTVTSCWVSLTVVNAIGETFTATHNFSVVN